MLRTVLALTLSVSTLSPTTAFAVEVGPEAGARERRGHVEVDTTELGETGAATSDKIQQRVEPVFTRQGVTPSQKATDPVMKINVAPLSGDTVGYRVSYQVDIEGKTVAGSSGFTDCRLCTEDELVDAAEASIELAAEHMEVEVEPPEPVIVDPPIVGPRPGEGDPPTDRVPLGPKGKAGVALLAVGGAGLLTGIGLVVPAPRNQDKHPTLLFTTRPAGYGVLAGGAAAAVVGAVLLILDRKAAKDEAAKSNEAPDKKTALRPAPWIGAGGGGVSLGGRF